MGNASGSKKRGNRLTKESAIRIQRPRRTRFFGLDSNVPLVAFGGSDSAIHLCRLDTREEIRCLVIPSSPVEIITCLRGGRPVFAYGSAGYKIQFVDFELEEAIRSAEIRGHFGAVLALVDLPSQHLENDLIASASLDSSVFLTRKLRGMLTKGVGPGQAWGRVVFKGHSDSVYGLCHVPSKNWLVSGSADKTIRVWDLEKRKAVLPDGIQDGSPVRAVAFGKNYVFSGSREAVKMYSLDNFECCRTFHVASQCPCRSLLHHPTEESLIFSGHFNGDVLLWDVRKADTCVKKGTMHSSGIVQRIVHVGSHRFASCAKDTVKVWDDDLAEIPATGDHEGKTAEMRTPGSENFALCCVVPFANDLEAAVELERLQFLVGSISGDGDGDEQGILSPEVLAMFVEVRVGSAVPRLRVFRSVLPGVSS